MVLRKGAISDRDLKFKLNRINWLDQEITRYRDYEWTVTGFHTAFFVAILYLLIDTNRRPYIINTFVSKILLGLAIFIYVIIACSQLKNIHIKLNRSRIDRDIFLKDIGEPNIEGKYKFIEGRDKFYEGKGALYIIAFIIWLIILFLFDVFLLYNNKPCLCC